jgi:hypothetical protein
MMAVALIVVRLFTFAILVTDLPFPNCLLIIQIRHAAILIFPFTHNPIVPFSAGTFGNRQKSVNHNNKAIIMPFCVK